MATKSVFGGFKLMKKCKSVMAIVFVGAGLLVALISREKRIMRQLRQELRNLPFAK